MSEEKSATKTLWEADSTHPQVAESVRTALREVVADIVGHDGWRCPRVADESAICDCSDGTKKKVASILAAVFGAIREPTEEMLDKGEYVNSEWLNDNAPIDQRMYREPAKAVWLAMLDRLSAAERGGGRQEDNVG